MWVACTDAWCGSQCWLKWVADPSKPTTRGSGGTTPWTSGTIHKDVPSEQPVPSETALNATRVVALRTSAGDLRIALKPEWHQPSVRFVQHAALGDFCTVKCELSRAEPCRELSIRSSIVESDIRSFDSDLYDLRELSTYSA